MFASLLDQNHLVVSYDYAYSYYFHIIHLIYSLKNLKEKQVTNYNVQEQQYNNSLKDLEEYIRNYQSLLKDFHYDIL